MNAERILSGRYEIKELLGRGGMAEVHAGWDTRLGRRVAIKLLRSDLARDPSFHERIKREAQSAARLNHPGIVGVYDSGEETFTESGGGEVQVPFIVMEFVEGQTLREVITQHGPLTTQESLDVVAGILAPLDYSHRKGIVHRDIKPANVMLTPEGDIKVMDFGIARALEDTSSLTQTQSVVGTAQYLSPEQAKGEVVDARSDLYSTACVLYELLTGRPPFVGDSQLAVAYQHVGETPKAPSELNHNLSPAVDRLLMHALQKERDDRYQDAFTFREDVLCARDGRPMSIDSEATTQLMNQPYASETATRVMATPAEHQPEYGSGPAHASQSGTEPGIMTSAVATVQEEEPDPERDRKRRGLMWTGIAMIVLVLAGLAFWVYQASKPPEIVTVQLADLSDKSVEEAKTYLQQNNLVAKEEEVADNDVKEGNVVSTDPGPGTEVPEGETVVLKVSTGPEDVKIPDLKGMSEAQARQELEKVGLNAGSNIEENSPDEDKGTVLSTEPKKGSTVKAGSTVDLVLSSGKVEVPDVIGMTKDDACGALEDKKTQLKCDVKEVETSDHTEGEVFEQSLQGGSTADQHSTVTIRVAKAPPPPSPEPSQAPEPSRPPFFPPAPSENDVQQRIP
ncbi:Stk1 family PASTA domain-containing Ser/Thr kinase [Brevibacterium sp. UMB1308A]|uniref:Stk1 family PASTA domain-containing Ser/Thr kinase n=1 Tax=Brevibacterium sp. UMB1308A TaxID=3050608 RepID=UPI00254B602A|nr:Stk1 family PASTA domain-containing Ser/Thr kinase [Brevibacterium sp. UMB1308A]MDK8346730.1 Stk1 family PASTA domain-containing Ser/Thr kinase [Brevibacterium sp. UMB1308B]MDK8714070.1 Stk1 family PASTA domain-containing Ser/Thr kinase [Brevibacterium sp. UMB1308A]